MVSGCSCYCWQTYVWFLVVCWGAFFLLQWVKASASSSMVCVLAGVGNTSGM